MRRHEIICELFVENEVNYTKHIQNIVNQCATKYVERYLVEGNLSKQEKIDLLENLLYELKVVMK